MDSSCLVMAPCGFALLGKLVGESAEVTGVAAGSEGSVDPPGEVAVGDPVDPVVPVGPAGPTGTTGSTGSPTATSPGGSTDPSLPAATPVTSADSPASLPSKANPQGAMTKQEESIAMPKPGQVNDHSSPALHPPK